MTAERFSMMDTRTRTLLDESFEQGMERYFSDSMGSNIDKLRAFNKFVPRQTVSHFLAKNELFQMALGVHGHIIECGVFLGAGLMTWANLSATFEPVNHIRRIVGFDTFSGFSGIHEKDVGDGPEYSRPGGLKADSYKDLQQAIALYDQNRPIGHIPRVLLERGDATKTIPQYVENNPHLVVAMLYLDFDVYEPTKVAIENFLPRMPKGAIIAFDELGQAAWPGETQAVLETIGLNNLRIRRFSYTSSLSYAVLE